MTATQKLEERFSQALTRLLNDQETAPPYHGQFGRTRDPGTRSAVQRDDEPLAQKPELYMSFQALLTLQYLNSLLEHHDGISDLVLAVLRSRRGDIEKAMQKAGAFAERLLINARSHGSRPFIKMRNAISFTPNNEFLSYRHTIGAAIIFLLDGRRADFQQEVIRELLKPGVQNADGGWPIADRLYTESDLLCSAHAGFLFRLALKLGDFKSLEPEIEGSLNRTIAFLTLKSRAGEWTYNVDPVGTVPFTARTYPEFIALLGDHRSSLAAEIPYRLLEGLSTDHAGLYTFANRSKTGIEHANQLLVRVAYALKVAAARDKKYLQSYCSIAERAMAAYSEQEYFDTYDLCCFLLLMADQPMLAEAAALSLAPQPPADPHSGASAFGARVAELVGSFAGSFTKTFTNGG